MTYATCHRPRFADNLRRGQVAEGLIAHWLRRRGNHVLPAYQIEQDAGKGPALHMAEGDSLVTPDLLAFTPAGRFVWIEAKSKSAATWYRKGRCWQTGLDARHWRDYVAVSERTGLDVWLLFVLEQAQPWHYDAAHGAPSTAPIGLYGERIDAMVGLLAGGTQAHASDAYARGMVYWDVAALRFLASMADLSAGVQEQAPW